ncbi:MAG: hypothetical protein HY819_07215 [Acidobacteria bacterium]|nr:hypothetical protein [Acidobacteriota bacterium]
MIYTLDERDVAFALSLRVSEGVTLADLGYRGKDFSLALFEDTNMLIITRADTPDILQKQLISRVRQPIESFFLSFGDVLLIGCLLGLLLVFGLALNSYFFFIICL